MLIKILRLLGIRATKENLTLAHVKSFIQAKFRRLFLTTEFKKAIDKLGVNDYLFFPLHKQEQVVFRFVNLRYHSQGKLCLASNMCPCECTTSEVILSDDSCDQGCFGPMMDKHSWEVFKTKKGIYIDLYRQRVVRYDNK